MEPWFARQSDVIIRSGVTSAECVFQFLIRVVACRSRIHYRNFIYVRRRALLLTVVSIAPYSGATSGLSGAGIVIAAVATTVIAVFVVFVVAFLAVLFKSCCRCHRELGPPPPPPPSLPPTFGSGGPSSLGNSFPPGPDRNP